MGFNTTLVIMNDCIHSMKEDPEIGAKIEDGILKLSIEKGPIDIPFKGYSGYIRAIETHHSDGLVPILVGGNDGRVLRDLSISWNKDDPEMELLLHLARKRGYTLRKTATK